MRSHRLVLMLAAVVALASVWLAGCKEEAEQPAKTTHEHHAKTATAESGAKYVNVRCPIMGSAIDPENATLTLTREFKGKKVAFCCGGCPGQWDKLSDEEKAAKLAKVVPVE